MKPSGNLSVVDEPRARDMAAIVPEVKICGGPGFVVGARAWHPPRVIGGVAGLASSRDLAAGLYRSVLGREPDDAGVGTWVAALDGGLDLPAATAAMAGSAEAQALIGRIYADVLGRPAEAAGVATWTGALGTGLTLAGVRAGVAGSAEAVATVGAVYRQALGRDADPVGLARYSAALGGGYDLGRVRQELARSDEAVRSLSTSHARVFGFAPSAATLSALQTELATGRPFADTIAVEDRYQRISGIFDDHWGYTIPAAYAADGQGRFLEIASRGYFSGIAITSRAAVPAGGASEFAPGPDTITIDVSKTANTPNLEFFVTIDGRALGAATITTGALLPFSSSTNFVTFKGDFGPGLHRIGITAAAPFVVLAASYNGTSFLKGGVGAQAGVAELFAGPEPQPAVTVLAGSR